MKKILLGVLVLLMPLTTHAAGKSADYFDATDPAATSTFSGNVSILGDISLGSGTGILSVTSGLLSTAAIAAPLTFSSNTIGCQMATSTQDGCLSASDWIRFNAAASSAAPAGSNSQIQFNQGGAFGADSKFVYIPTTGFLGVGTSSQYRSNNKWDFVAETNDANGAVMTVTNYTSGFSPLAAVTFRTARGTQANPAAVQSFDNIGAIGFNAFDGTSFPLSAPVVIRGFAGENWSSSARGSGISFLTTANGGTARVEKMRLTPSGQLLVGTTSLLSSTDALIVGGGVTMTGSLNMTQGVTVNGGSIQLTQGGVYINDGNVIIGDVNCNAHNFCIKTAGPGQIMLDSTDAHSGSCIIMRDASGDGYSYITVEDGVISASTNPC